MTNQLRINKLETEKYNLYDGEIVLEYNDKKHTYKEDSKIVYGVTSIAGIISKPALIPWAVNCMRDRLRAEQEEMGWKAFAENFVKIVEMAKGERSSVSEVAKELGTRVHDMAERWQTKGADHVKLMMEMLETDSKEERLSYTALLQFFSSYKFKPISLETKCFSRKHRYAGTVDYYGEIDGKLTVMDYKTSKAVYEGYPLQATAYASALLEEGYKVDQTMITRVGKDGVLEVVIEKDWKKYLPIFLSAKTLYEYRMSLKSQKYKNKNKK